jgi:hypothetical protein
LNSFTSFHYCVVIYLLYLALTYEQQKMINQLITAAEEKKAA